MEVATVTWFPSPVYPDGDPLLVRIDFTDEIPHDLPPFLFFSDIDPTGVMYELVGTPPTHAFMMRLRGLDTNPIFS